MRYVRKLEEDVQLNQGKHRATHHMNGRLFPFVTRNPERVKFKDPFNEIVGLIVRYSLGMELVIEDVEGEYLKNIKQDIVIDADILDSEIRELFSFNFSEISTPEMLKYFPVPSIKNKETVGKIRLAKYIVELFNLKENEAWISYVSQSSHELSLYDEVVNDNLPKLAAEKKENAEKYIFFDQENYLEYFNKDLSALMKEQSFFMENIGILISYYFFYYTIQQSVQIDQIDRKMLDLWFAFDKEKLSKGRNAARAGYQLVLEKSRELLVNQDMIDYLNTLTGQPEDFKSLETIYQNKKLRQRTLQRLVVFNHSFAKVLGKGVNYQATEDFTQQVRQLKDYLDEAMDNATLSRYSRSFREFSGLGFIRARGRLGYVLNASQELVLMFVGVIVGQNSKMLLDEFFNELEARGIKLDTQSRREVVSYFEQINILEKLSDSGDAQYVKSIL